MAEFALIVHADDFGESVEITRGICTAIEAGAVTSTTIMANMPGTDDALRRVAGLADRASFGVHINLCEGASLTRCPSLTGAGRNFYGKRELAMRAFGRRLSLPEIEAEIVAQIGRVRDQGIKVSHVDGHKHLHMLPGVCSAVAHVLPKFGIERVRVTRLGSLAGASAATLMRQCLARGAARKFAAARLRSPAYVTDIQTIMRGGQATLAKEGLSPGGRVVEIFCHPGTELADLEKPGSCNRHQELQYLMSTDFQEYLHACQARLISYWDV